MKKLLLPILLSLYLAEATAGPLEEVQGRKIDSKPKYWQTVDEKHNKYYSGNDFYSAIEDGNKDQKIENTYLEPEVFHHNDNEIKTDHSLVNKKEMFNPYELLNGIYDITTEIMYIVLKSSFIPTPAEEKTLNDQIVDNALWPDLKRVFKKYFKLVRDTEVLNGLQEILPIDELESAVDRDDGAEVWSTLMNSFTPKFFYYLVELSAETFWGAFHFGQHMMNHSENRQGDSPLVKALEMSGQIVQRLMFSLTRTAYVYSNTLARSLGSFIYPDMIDGAQSRDSSDDSGLLLPLGLVAGLGGFAITGYYLMNSVSDNDINRVKRDVAIDNVPNVDTILKSIDSVDFDGLVEDKKGFSTDEKKTNNRVARNDKLFKSKLKAIADLTHPLLAYPEH